VKQCWHAEDIGGPPKKTGKTITVRNTRQRRSKVVSLFGAENHELEQIAA